MRKSRSISVSILYRKSVGKPISGIDQQKFDAWYNESEKHRLYYKRFCVQQEKIMARDCSVVDVERRLMEIKFKRRVKYRSNWWKLCGVAATMLILFSIGWMYWTKNDVSCPVVVDAGLEKASVTLRSGQGKRIVLDSTLVAQTIRQDCVAMRVGIGVLEYDRDSVAIGKLVYNQVDVPPSGEYMIVLSDGTKVYLNSASSLCYPTVFPPGERRVKLSGEAYFVVAKGERPFIVDTPLEEVKVFGTEFNVMAYEDEEELQTTLVKGSVGVLAKGMEFIGFQKIVPGEQFLLNRKTGKIEIVPVDVFPYVAWKDGLFVSQNDNLETILRKMARWFDVEIFYQNPELKQKRFFGIMKRRACLQEVLDVIAKAGDVHFEVNERVVLVRD